MIYIWSSFVFIFSIILYKRPACIFLLFCLLFLFTAFRYDYGNDYGSYMSIHECISNGCGLSVVNVEFGYYLFNMLFSNYLVFIAFLSLFYCFCFCYFFVKYIDEEYWWFSAIVFLLLPNLFMVHLSSIRQMISICIFILSIKYLFNRSFMKYSACILFAATFHYSALVLLPAYYICRPDNYNKFDWIILATSSVFVIICFMDDSIFINILNYISGLYPKYKFYLRELKSTDFYRNRYLIGSLNFTVIASILYFLKDQTPLNKIFYRMAVWCFMGKILAMFFLMFARISMYFEISLIIFIPLFVMQIRSHLLKTGVFMFFLFYLSFTYARLFTSPITVEKYSKYQTVLSIL